MAKAKIARKSTWVDMTPFVDVAFLLLTFFMLATKFKPAEAVPIDTPTSTAQISLPDNYMQISVDKTGKIFFRMDGVKTRAIALRSMASKYNIAFTPDEVSKFSAVEQFGSPIAQLKSYLNLTSDQQKAQIKIVPGIPVDTSAAGDNQLFNWVREARLANPKAVIAIKGDRNANLPVFNKIIKTLQDQDANRFNLITGMESDNQK